MSSKRIFTYREAKGLMPRVRDLTHVAFQRTEELVKDLQTAELTPEWRTDLEEEYARVTSEWSEGIGSIGCEIKGLWLVDFDNGNGYYCWKYPEKNLDYFHTYQDGFSGRMRIN